MKKKNESGTPLWKVEQGRKLHNTFVVQMKHQVNGNDLQSALEKTLQVYPVITSSVIYEDGVALFVNNDSPCTVLQGENGWVPGCKKLNGHQFYVTYKENTIRMALSHVITDGGGMIAFAKTLIYYYCCIHDGKSYNSTGIMVNTEHDDNLETDFWTLDYADVPDIEKVSFEKVGYTLPESLNTAGKSYILSKMSVPSDAFMRMVKEKHTSPSIMAFLLFAQAVYAVRTEAKEQPIVGRITVDARKALGIPHTFLNCSLGAQLSVFWKDFQETNIKKLAEELRISLKTQTQPDYLRYVAKNVAASRSFPRDVKPTVSISYMGHNANNLRKSNRIFRRSNFPLMRTKRTLKRTIRFDRNGLTHTK